MLDGNRYYGSFPDEAASSATPDAELSVRATLAKLAALEQELARYLADPRITDSRS